MDANQWHVRVTMRVPSFYEEYHMFNYTFYSINNDDEMYYLRTIRPNISKEGIYVLVEFESVHPQAFSNVQRTYLSAYEDYSNVTIIMHIVSDEPSMLYPDIQEDDEDDDDDDTEYDVSTFLDMGSGEQIDNLIESRTIRLLDWNDV
ncbi:hypothetical protein M9H77_09639 [Catharanthus roseus]|uniref:Uncharacterized protein n=1 Tax=Catharanthus roseus TaxID=4058 RepID=A0ACC0C1I7_CATRO|nr:hypothetical protein M9H77_09639 [Catharanthus roseus]